MLGGSAARRRGVILVGIATVLWSSAGLFARLLGHLDIWTVLCGRSAFGALFLGAAAFVEWRRGVLGRHFGLGPLAPLLIISSAIAMMAYIAAIKMTTVAEVAVIYTTLPFVVAAMAFVMLGERPSFRTLAAAGIALAGVVLMVGGAVGTGQLIGQGLSLLMTVCFALMVVLQRRDPTMSMTSINTAAAVGAAITAFCFSPHPPVTPADLILLSAFGLTTVCVAFILFLEGAKHIPAAESALISMTDIVLAPLWVFVVFGENPGLMTFVGGALVVVAVLWRLAPERARAVAPAAPLP